MVLKQAEIKQNPMDVEFNKVTLWVQFHNVPIACMESSVITRLGERVVKVVDLDLGDGTLSLGRIAKARVVRRVDQPLLRCIPLADGSTEKEVLVLLQYERLPDFYFACGRLGHISKDCDDENVDKIVFQFDEWIRAGSHLATRRRGMRDEVNPSYSKVMSDEIVVRKKDGSEVETDRAEKGRMIEKGWERAGEGDSDEGADEEVSEGSENVLDVVGGRGSLLEVGLQEGLGREGGEKEEGNGVGRLGFSESRSKKFASPKKLKHGNGGSDWKRRTRDKGRKEGLRDLVMSEGEGERNEGGRKKKNVEFGDESGTGSPPEKGPSYKLSDD